MSAAPSEMPEASTAPKTTSSVHELHKDKPPFGSRFLTEDADVWSQNAWDHVPPPEDQDEIIAASLAKQRLAPVPDDDKHKYNEKPAKHWDNFYKTNAGNFFKNRKWLHLEFPELVAAADASAGPRTVVEIGCGAGNAIFPLLSANSNPELRIHAFDYSSHAVKLVQNNPLYLSPPCGTMNSAVWDLSSDSLPEGVQPGTADIIVLVFVLSALHPNEWNRAVSNIRSILKPGGLVLFRDYGRHDLTQLRFKTGRLLDDNFYIRGDKTRVYFFELDELAILFTGSRAPKHEVHESADEVDDEALSTAHSPAPATPDEDTASTSAAPPVDIAARHPLFGVEQLGVDRRLIVNRKRQLKMYRVWMQGKFRKL
ncbi:methyltransferase [Artomyces pyxidatus]|uniref:Methyltransferase n=1 Tax=Artomyces pyxidatus TaxID=48021 RepID=A0ACB8SSV1_9AGAM|nr:methyltransferase [Artomyces pyxidatus]